MSNLYEMHVYTMGTRSYADAICSVIDPTGSTFGGRILSRDESGSEDLSIVIGVQLMVVGLGFSQKSLKRLFPTDQSMVVVIDDRSDVWADCPNLVKVVPCMCSSYQEVARLIWVGVDDFFVGIGDINGSFLPPTSPNPTSSPSSSPTAAASSTSTESPSSASSSPTPITLPELSGLIAQAKLLDQVSEERPLAKMQEELEKKGDAEEAVAVAIAINGVDVGKEDTKSKEEMRSTTPPDSPTKARKPLLNGCDEELDRVADVSFVTIDR